MKFIGIDPGRSGGIAVIGTLVATVVVPMPIIVPPKGRFRYDIAAIRDLLVRAGDDVLVLAEQPMPLPPKFPGGIANYQRGVGEGFEFLCAGLFLPFEFVRPHEWQKAMHKGASGSDTKQRSLMAAKRLFPGVSLRPTEKSRKDSDGMADALLIAEYARRYRSAGQEAKG